MPPSRPLWRGRGEVLLAERRPSPVISSALTTPLFSPAWESYSCGSVQLCFESLAWEGGLKNIHSARPPLLRVSANIPQLKDVMTCKHPSQDRAIHGKKQKQNPAMMAGLGLLATIPWKVMWLAMVISRLVAPPHIYESARVFKNCPMVVLFPHGPHRLLDHEQCLQDCLPSRQDLLCPTHHPSHQVPQASIQPCCPEAAPRGWSLSHGGRPAPPGQREGFAGWEDSSKSIPLLLPACAGYQIGGSGETRLTEWTL